MLFERPLAVAVFLGVLAGLLATGWGLMEVKPLSEMNFFIFKALPRFILLVALILSCSLLLKVNFLVSGSIIAVLIVTLSGNLWPLIVVIWFILAAFIVGSWFLSRFSKTNEGHSFIISFLLGAAIYGFFTGLMAYFPVSYPGVYGMMLLLPVFFGKRRLYTLVNSAKTYVIQTRQRKWIDLIIAIISLVHLSVALMPEVGHDALAVHLFVPDYIVQHHAWSFDASKYIWAVWPMMGNWLYTIAYMLAGETGARLMNAGFIFSLCWLIGDLIKWAGGNPSSVKWAVLLFLTTPLTFLESSSLFVESIWSSFLVAGSLLLLKSLKEKESVCHFMPASSILLGAALSSKIITLTFLPGLFLVLLLNFRIWWQKSLAGVVLISLFLFLSIGSVPYITAWVVTENPVFPMFNSIFQSPYYPPVDMAAPTFNQGISWDTIYHATFNSPVYLESKPGASGFQWILLLFPALFILLSARNYNSLIIFALALTAIVLTFYNMAYLRYIFPALVWVSAAIGVAFTAQHSSHIIRNAFLGAGAIAVILNIVFLRSATNYGTVSYKALISPSGRWEYLERSRPIRNAVEAVNRLNKRKSPVAIFSSPEVAGVKSDVLHASWYNHDFLTKVFNLKTPDEFADFLLDSNVDYILFDLDWRTPELQNMIKMATEEISIFGNQISVRRVKREFLYQDELLSSPNFYSKKEWNFSEESSVNNNHSGYVNVDPTSWISQEVGVKENRKALLQFTSFCATQPGQGKIEVTWLDKNANKLHSDYRFFRCQLNPASYSMDLSPPPQASRARLIAEGNTTSSVTFTQISLRQ